MHSNLQIVTFEIGNGNDLNYYQLVEEKFDKSTFIIKNYLMSCVVHTHNFIDCYIISINKKIGMKVLGIDV